MDKDDSVESLTIEMKESKEYFAVPIYHFRIDETEVWKGWANFVQEEITGRLRSPETPLLCNADICAALTVSVIISRKSFILVRFSIQFWTNPICCYNSIVTHFSQSFFCCCYMIFNIEMSFTVVTLTLLNGKLLKQYYLFNMWLNFIIYKNNNYKK